MTIGDKIRKYRKLAGLTQKQLGEKSGTSETTIKQYEGEKRQPRIEQLCKIAEALDVNVTELISDTNDTKYNALLKIAHAKLVDAELLTSLKETDAALANDIVLRSVMTDLETKGDKIAPLFALLNESGQKKVRDYTKDLAKIPEYRKEPEPQDPDTPK